LIAPDRRQPHVDATQRLGHGLDLAKAAAQVGVALPELGAVIGLLLLGRVARADVDEMQPRVASTEALFQFVRFLEEEVRVQVEHVHG